MIKPAVLMVLVAATALPACSRLKRDDGVRFEGERFRIQAKKVDRDDRSLFRVTASPASKTLDGARQAAAYGGTRYCIQEYGTSVIAWTQGPDDDPIFDGDRIVMEGQCKP
ncbi:hypothetical protein [Cognatishimia activa]|nr:hypothetical protein [Cognatishimia activa]